MGLVSVMKWLFLRVHAGVTGAALSWGSGSARPNRREAAPAAWLRGGQRGVRFSSERRRLRLNPLAPALAPAVCGKGGGREAGVITCLEGSSAL